MNEIAFLSFIVLDNLNNQEMHIYIYIYIQYI